MAEIKATKILEVYKPGSENPQPRLKAVLESNKSPKEMIIQPAVSREDIKKIIVRLEEL